ncbi:MAG: hypothetical protein IJC68_01980 [Firmicutes bacterium]|nr:hypothetical protein [Bacillota bacterium]
MNKEPLTEQAKTEEKSEVFQISVPEGKRTALLRYLIIMFAVAFVLVLMSMVLQVRSSNATVSELHRSSTSAIKRAEALQDENRSLSNRVAALEQELQAVQNDLEVAYAANNVLRAENKEAVTARRDLQTVSDALARVLMGPRREGDVNHSLAVETVNQMKQYLSPDVSSDFETWLKKNQ